MNDLLSAPARLLRGFAVEFLTCHDVKAVSRIMEPDYRLLIGEHVFQGRDEVYLPATAAQLEQFPGLCVTIHDIIVNPDAGAIRFTEHGVSAKHKGRAAAWGGVAIFHIKNGRLHHGWAEEDYFARKRQLSTGQCDAVRAPHPAPWDCVLAPPSEAAERVARDWLSRASAIQDVEHIDEISVEGPSFGELISVEALRINALFSAGERVAFHATGFGRYAGGFADIAASRLGAPIQLSIAGLSSVRAGRVVDVQIAFDRLGLYRRLLEKTDAA